MAEKDEVKKNKKKRVFKHSKSRQALTFVRIWKYGIDNYRRNSWLTIAATVVMIMTLTIIFGTVVSTRIMNDTVTTLKDKVDMSIYLKNSTSDDVADKIMDEAKKLSSVTSVSYVTPDQGRNNLVQQNSSDAEYLSAINEATNEVPGVIRIHVTNIDDTTQLENFVKTNDLLKQDIDPNHNPSFSGDRRAAIKSIGRSIDFIQKVGISLAVIFIIVSFMIIFNTIRMAIFNRREEIDMMKLIGADRSFIRGPFLVEAAMYGIVAALISVGIVLGAIYLAESPLKSYSISVQPTVDFMLHYLPIVILAMIFVGVIISCVSSYIATRRYLKI